MGDKNQKSQDKAKKQDAAKKSEAKAAHDLKQAAPVPSVGGETKGKNKGR